MNALNRLLSGRSQVQLPPGTPLLDFKLQLMLKSETLHPLWSPPVSFPK